MLKQLSFSLIAGFSLLQINLAMADDSVSRPFWYGGEFDLIYDAGWVQFNGGNARLDDNDLLIVNGQGNYENGAPYGIRFVTGLEWEKYASGQTVRVAFTAKSLTNHSIRYKVMYATNDTGASGWKEAIAGPTFTTFSFDYKVPPMDKGRNDFVLLVPEAVPGGVMIQDARLKLIETIN